MARECLIPSGFEWLAGRVHYVHVATRTEICSSCPECGGEVHKNGEWPDRFRFFVGDGRVRAWCRKCGLVLFPDSNDPNWQPDYDKMRMWNEERELHYRQQKEQAERALAMLASERSWLEWHESMSQERKDWWLNRGVNYDWQEFWKLGYVDSRTFYQDDKPFTRAAATIPKFGFGWNVKNIDFRIQDPPENAGKYRQLNNLPPSVYNTTPHLEGYTDEVFVVEGSIKAMVLSTRSGPVQRQVIGIPSCTSWAGVEKELANCGRVWVMFDPDATAWGIKFAKAVGANARIVELPVKPDDALLLYGMTENNLLYQLRQATKGSDYA